MTRRTTVALALGFLAALLAFDLAATDLNPYAAPRLLALGSGAAPAGGFCGAPAGIGGS